MMHLDVAYMRQMKSEVGRLTKLLADKEKAREKLHKDVVAQREVMALAAVKLETGNIQGAIDTLNGALTYREAQREPRKSKA